MTEMAAEFPRTGLFIVVTTYLVLFVLLRSVVLPAKALVMNSLSIVASFGALVWIFQEGNLSALLGFQPLGYVETTQPVILFCVLFGLSMDYEVFLLSRMKETWDRTGDNVAAVAFGLERSGRIVTSAALIVVVVAGSFAFADIVLIKALGVGMAIAVALDATVVRALLVPATMRLLGRWNWWIPARVERWLASRLPLAEGDGRTAEAGAATRRAAAAARRLRRRWPLAIVAFVGGCAGGPVLANPPAARPSPAATPAPSLRPADPVPVVFPRDDAPHDRLTEWWYYTGHLRDTASGDRYGFEFVIFRAERGDFPVSWASHLAITDEAHGRFLFAQRAEIGPRSTSDRRDGGLRPGARARSSRPPDADEPGLADDRGRRRRPAGRGDDAGRVDRGRARRGPRPRPPAGGAKAPALHDRDGWIDFGPGGGSYYYSRTRMSATGTLTVDGRALAVEGEAWFDHQWGDFISVGGGGWDWFAVNLADGSDLTLSLVRDRAGGYPLVYGTYVDAAGSTTHLPADAFRVTVTGHWTSPRTGAVYPAGWHVEVPGPGPDDRPGADRRRPGARHAGHDRRRVLGGLAGGPGDAERGARGRRGVRGAHGVRGRPLGSPPAHRSPPRDEARGGRFGRPGAYSADATGTDASRRLCDPGDARPGAGRPGRTAACRSATSPPR